MTRASIFHVNELTATQILNRGNSMVSECIEITAFKCNIIHSTELRKLQIYAPGLIGINAHGTIEFLVEYGQHVHVHYTKLLDLGDQLLIPGFVDGHAHAPQSVFAGLGMHLPLLEWLQAYTFPCEAAFSNIQYAREMYSECVRRLLRVGTTTCSYFGTTHLKASKVLVDVIEEVGQRAFIGKVNMDRNGTQQLTEDTEESIQSTRAFVEYVMKKKNALLTPVLTPRFVPSTSSKLMIALGTLSREYNPPLRIQSHLSESQREVEWVRELHPECSSYTQVYDHHGLLHERSYMAHCIWCSDKERALLAQRQSGVIHCPNSNFSLKSGILNVRQLLDVGIKVGLGTDIAGGYAVSMLDAIRQSIIASKVVAMQSENVFKALSYEEAFFLATLGGAHVLGVGDIIGNFDIGKDFDALVIDVGSIRATSSSVLDRFQQFLFLGDDRAISQIFVKGKPV
uniref:Guanine deaminase n=1 Tax=Albugo laibachii Nc14 TaxID=890382 RepID=F0WRJ4_9STRA|nr:guanine deaminase putative [Albugo laibachii Nc14]|eukprot:CCA23957.1 guanine deaminase putative [Albugo laibachii Nc14]